MVKGNMQISDDSVVEKYRKGDTEAFNCLVERYGKPLYNFIYRMLADRTASEDVLQEVFLRVIRNIDRYEMRGRFKSWIFTIANHLVVSELRRRSKRRVLSLDEEIGSGESGLELHDVVGDERYLPDVLAERRELREKLDDAIQLLPFGQRQVLMMREVSGLQFKEIASVLECPLNTVLGRMHYALKNLRQKLAELYGPSRDSGRRDSKSQGEDCGLQKI